MRTLLTTVSCLLAVGCAPEGDPTPLDVAAKSSSAATSCSVRGSTGDIIFETDLGGMISGAPAFSGGTAYIGQFEGGTMMYAVGDDGRVLKSANIAYSVESSPAVSPDGTTVYVNTVNLNGMDIPADTLSDGVTSIWDGVGAQALDASTLALVGAPGFANTGADGSPAVSADGNSVYVGSVEGPDALPEQVWSFAGRSMDLNWDYDPPGWSYSSPVLDARQNLYMGSEEAGSTMDVGHFYSLNRNGRQRWSLETEGSACGGPAIYTRSGRTWLLMRTFSGHLLKVSDRGVKNWEVDLNTLGWGVPVLGSNNGLIYVTTTYPVDSTLDTHLMSVLALSERDGSVRWEFSVNNANGSTPVVGDRAVYVVDADGTVFALDKNTGAELWSTPTGHPSYVGYAGLNACGALQFGSSDGHYVSVQTESSGMESTSDCPTYRCDYGRTGNQF